MTTTVKVEAHCATDKQVRVTLGDENGIIENFKIDDGETAERVVYDNIVIQVKEIPRD